MGKLLALILLASFCVLAVAQSSNPNCPYCLGLTCGSDGVGGSCGTCVQGQTCTRGVCVCDRGCDGLECGPDNCGTLCGTCLSGQTCNNGICTGACTPQCTRSDGSLRTCGWDRCSVSGSCGTCPNSTVCQYRCRDGNCECVPNCDNKNCGDDGCGGSCGTCTGGGICQGSNSAFPGQCYIPCFIQITVQVRENKTGNLVGETCTVSVTGPNNFNAPNNVYPGPNPGYFPLNISSGEYGSYTFSTTCLGYLPDVETHVVNVSNQVVTLLVNWAPISIVVRDATTQQLLNTATIIISAASYSLTVNWVSPSYSWTTNGFMTYSFTTSSPGYITATTSQIVTYTTTLITLYLSIPGIPIQVSECVAGAPVSQATITVAGVNTPITYNNGATFNPPNGYATYTFTTSATNYVTNTQTVSVTSTTSVIKLCVNYRPINVTVIECGGNTLINGASITVTSTFYTTYSSSFSYSSSGTTWTPVGYSGNYIFDVSAPSYVSVNSTQTVAASTSSIVICLPAAAFCGDGICNANETANPNSLDYCYDCGRVRGVISIAIGQKNQLTNITVSLWADPTNPAYFIQNGTTLPLPDYITYSDSKGYFTFNTLSFDAPANSVSQGKFSRRFYFSLSGSYVDQQGVATPLLDLWWNYLLTNKEWSGSGSLTGTNTSPQLYFYMTPPFPASQTLIRTILSWGVLISDPAVSLPDLDILTAGPVEPDSITTYGTGIVNFQNMAAHAADTTILPFGNLVTDSAQGYGPEVMDIYGFNGELQIGYSTTYSPGAPANAYEIWVDRPNSPANADSASIFLYDTNSFLVVYVANTTISTDIAAGHQALFDLVTGVAFAYGFYNTDQWNQIPTTATIWHVFDISQLAGGVVWDGFPGENNTADTTPYPGAKYGYGSANFQTTKSVPCGHVSSRGANPAWCPGKITYPASRRSVQDEI